MYGRDTVAPPGNQAANGEHKLHAYSTEDLSLLDKNPNMLLYQQLCIDHEPCLSLNFMTLSLILIIM